MPYSHIHIKNDMELMIHYKTIYIELFIKKLLSSKICLY